MTLVDKLFRRGGPPRADLAAVQGCLTAGVARWSGRQPDLELVRARLADGCRDSVLDPPVPEELDARVAGLDDEGWRRLAVLAGALDLPDVQTVVAGLAAARPAGELLEAGFIGVARETPLLTLDLLGRSQLRVEELARRLLAGLGATVQGESVKASRDRLNRLDYARLLAEAERAREAAAGRLEELKKLQDEQEQNRPRRGKW